MGQTPAAPLWAVQGKTAWLAPAVADARVYTSLTCRVEGVSLPTRPGSQERGSRANFASTPATGTDAITYIVQGAGGSPLNATSPDALYAASNGTDYSYLRLTIDGCTATGAAIADDGRMVDSFTLDGCE